MTTVAVLSADLMDRSKISAAFPDATIVRSVEALIEVATNADLVVVDLRRVDDLAAVEAIAARVVGFGSHVDEEMLASATAAGIEALPRSVFFRRLTDGSV